MIEQIALTSVYKNWSILFKCGQIKTLRSSFYFPLLSIEITTISLGGQPWLHFKRYKKITKLNDFLPLNAVLKQFDFFAVPYSSIRFSITIIKLFFLKVNLSVVRKNLFDSQHCSKIKTMHDYAVLDIELTLFSEKALLFSNAAATLRLLFISRRKQFELL